jgi:predicted GIY-YIG superfamily endonuclease
MSSLLQQPEGAEQGIIYLLHFSSPISPDHTTQHYLGFTTSLEERLEQHRQGKAARLTEVAKERNITFILARTFKGTRTGERLLKNRKEGPALCPICSKLKGRPAKYSQVE